MPEDQDQITTRRRSRRSETAAPAGQDNTSPVLSAPADDATSPSSLSAQATPRATSSRRRTARTETAAPGESPSDAASDSPATTDAAPKRATSRRRVARATGDESSAMDAGQMTEDAAPEKPKQPRVSRRRAAHTAETATEAGASSGVAAEQMAAAPSVSEPLFGVREESSPATASQATDQGVSGTTRRPYRFGRRAPTPATDERLPGSQRRRPPAAQEAIPSGDQAETAPPNAITSGPTPSEPETPEASHEPVVRPLRRSDRAGWPAQEQRPRRDLGVAGGEGYRTPRGPDQNGARGQGGRQPGQGRGAGQQPGRNNGPYMPGGRGHGQNGSRENFGVIPGGAPAQGGYGPYTPFDPYTGYPNTPPPEQQRRPVRNRPGYGNQPGYPTQQGYPEQRGPRTPMESYREREAGLRNPQQGRGGPGGRGQHDRHGLTNPRQGRPPRDLGLGRYGQGGGVYAPIPGAGAEDRYQGGRAAGPQLVGRTVEMSGVLWLGGGPGMGLAELLDGRTLQSIARLDPNDVRRLGLRSGDAITAQIEERGNRRSIVSLDRLNDREPENVEGRPVFEQLTASFPDRRIRLEQGAQPISSRIIDLFAPLGFGSRALIVAPPKTGKTTLIREAAESVLKGYPDAVVMAVLVGERPEEVTDLRARLEPRGGLVYAASFDEHTERHAWLVQVAVERAKRVAESGRDAFMVLDSLTRLARAENLATRGQGRTLSGGIDAQALDTGRRAFGAARNLEEGGSLTILATCLVDTGSRQDDVVYEEFKGTGNMELHLSRELAQRRLFPAVDAVKSGTRREEMLLSPEELRAATALRRKLADMQPQQATQQLLTVMERTPSNSALIQAIDQSNLASRA